MSVNTISFHPQTGLPQLESTEKIYTTSENVQLQLITGSGFPGQLGNYFCNVGQLFLTNKRIIYITKSTNRHFRSLSVPLHFIYDPTTTQEGIFSKTELIICQVKPGNMQAQQGLDIHMLNNDACLKLTFHDGHSLEFHASLIQLKSRPQDPSELPEYDSLCNTEDVDPVPAYDPTL